MYISYTHMHAQCTHTLTHSLNAPNVLLLIIVTTNVHSMRFECCAIIVAWRRFIRKHTYMIHVIIGCDSRRCINVPNVKMRPVRAYKIHTGEHTLTDTVGDDQTINHLRSTTNSAHINCFALTGQAIIMTKKKYNKYSINKIYYFQLH